MNAPRFAPDERERRIALIVGLRELATRLGRSPTQEEVNAHFGQRWQCLSRLFIGRRRTGIFYMNGYHRWLRAAGLKPNPRGWWKGRANPCKGKQRVMAYNNGVKVTRRKRAAMTQADQLTQLSTAVETERQTLVAQVAQLTRRCECGGLLRPGFEQDHRCNQRRQA